MAEIDEQEAIFWSSEKEKGPAHSSRSSRRNVGGRIVVEKFPQHGHVGEFSQRAKAPGVRFNYMIRHDGFEAPICLTNAAAHLDPQSKYGQYVRMKARFLGWFPTSACPAALLATGQLNPSQIVDKRIVGADPCPHGGFNRHKLCPHARAEKVARTAQYNADLAEKLAAYKDNGERMLEAQVEQTKALVTAIMMLTGGGKSVDAAVEEVLAKVKGERAAAPVVDQVIEDLAGEPATGEATPPPDKPSRKR